jgi:hypothetical protein
MGEDFLDNLIMETRDIMEDAFRCCPSFSNQDMDMRMKIDAGTKGLDYGHHTRHELQARHCVQEFLKSPHRRETERIEELSLEAEKQPEHLRDCEDNLTVRNIEQKLLPHPLAPFLPALGMTRWTKPAGLAGKHKQPLFPTVGTPDAGKSAHRIAAVQIFSDNILDYRPEIPVLLRKRVSDNCI